MGRKRKLKGDQLVIPQLAELGEGDYVSCSYGSKCRVYYVSESNVWVYVTPGSVRAVRREDCLKVEEVV